MGQAWVPIVIGLVQTILLPLAGFIYRDLRRQIDEAKCAREKLDAELRQLKDALPIQYVLKEDYIRFNTRVEAKLDKLIDAVAGVANKLSDHVSEDAQKGAA